MRVVMKCFLLFIFAAVVCFCKPVFAQGWDAKLLNKINPQNPNSQYWINTSNSVYWASAAVPAGSLLYGLISGDEKAKHSSFDLFLSLGANMLVTDLMKKSFNRTRPGDKYPDMIYPVSPTTDMSMPSGHTSMAFATATTLSLQYKKWYVTVPAYAWAASVGYSRMYLGKHYPSDVLGGAALGIGAGYASHWLNRKLFKRYYTTPKPYAY